MNIFDEKNFDYKSLVAQLLWRHCVEHGDEYSGYDIITEEIPYWCKDKPKEACQRGYQPGDIVRDIRFLSYYIGPTRQLSWKELTLALGFWKDILLPDHHNCSICQKRKKCKAYFKDNPNQERCSVWMDDHGHPDDEEEYKNFIDNLLNPKYDDNISIEPIGLNDDEIKTIANSMNISIEELKNMIDKANVSKQVKQTVESM